MNDTTKAILDAILKELNNFSARYAESVECDYDRERVESDRVASSALLHLADQACDIVDAELKMHKEIGWLNTEFDAFSIIYPTETEAETADETTAKAMVVECQHRGEDGKLLDDCDFDGRDDTCRFNPKNGGNPQDSNSNRVYCPVFGGWIMRYDACRGGCDYDRETDTCKLYRNNTRKGGDDRNG